MPEGSEDAGERREDRRPKREGGRPKREGERTREPRGEKGGFQREGFQGRFPQEGFAGRVSRGRVPREGFQREGSQEAFPERGFPVCGLLASPLLDSGDSLCRLHRGVEGNQRHQVITSSSKQASVSGVESA